MTTNSVNPAQCYQFPITANFPCDSICPQCKSTMRRVLDAGPTWNNLYDICKCGYLVDIPVEELVSE